MAEFSIPLDIPDVEILKVETNNEDGLIISIKSSKSSICCRKCGNLISKRHGYGETLFLRHLPILDRTVCLKIKPARYQCLQCDDHPKTTEQPDWYSRRSKFTKAYEEYLMRLLIGSTITDVGRKER